MKRYSTLYGAFTIEGADGRKRNQYIEITKSEGLPAFLKELRIGNPQKAVEDTNKFLSGYVPLPGYEAQPQDDKPMLIRYAPIYLGRRKDWNNDVGSFCAISGSAPDNKKDGRDGKYYHTHFIEKEQLLISGEDYNYLDHIFGTYFVTWQEKNAYQQFPIDCDTPPKKVTPVMRPMDEQIVKTVTMMLLTKLGAYKPMKVVLKLEKGCAYNRRAMELLTQIYSLLPPEMATEIGFASYQHPDKIPELYRETSMRLFLTCAEADVSRLSAEDVLVLDLNKPIEIQMKGIKGSRKLWEAISYWYGLDWNVRLQLMERIFVNVDDPQDGNLYEELTRRFDTDPFWAWYHEAPDRGKLSSLQELKEKYEQFPICAKIPYMHEQFRKAARKSLKDNLTVIGLVREMAMRFTLADDQSTPEVQQQIALYEFGKTLIKKDITVGVAAAVKAGNTRIVTERVERKNAAEIAGLKNRLETVIQKHSEEMAAAKQHHDEEIVKLNERHAGDLQAADRAKAEAVAAEIARTVAVQQQMAAAKQHHDEEMVKLNERHAGDLQAADRAKAEAVAAEVARTVAVQQQMAAAKQHHDEEIVKLNERHAGDLQAADRAKAEAVAAEVARTAAVQQRMDAAKQHHDKEIVNLKQMHASDLNAAEEAKEAAVAAEHRKGMAAVAAQKEENARVAKLLDEAKVDLEEEKAAKRLLDEELAKAKNAAAKRKQKIEENESEIERLNNLLVDRGIDPTPPEPEVTILGVPVPKRSIKVIAIAAATAFLIGGILSGVLVALLTGGKDEGENTVPPAVVQQAGTNTPVSPATTAPETTAPETTVPETTAPAAEPVRTALLQDGSVDWAYVRENVKWIDNLETDPDAMNMLLAEQVIVPEGWTMEAVLTLEGWAAADDATVLPAFIMTLTNEMSSIIAPEALSDWADLIVVAENRCVAAHYGNEKGEAIKAAAEVAVLTGSENARLELFAYSLEDGRMVDLTDVMAVTNWCGVSDINFDEQDLEQMKNQLGTNRLPVSIVQGDDQICVYDYADDPVRAQELKDLMSNHGYVAATSGDFVLVLVHVDM